MKKERDIMSTMTELFGSLVFDDKVMEERLPKQIYKAMQKTKKHSRPSKCLPQAILHVDYTTYFTQKTVI